MVYHLDLVRETVDVNCDAYMAFYQQHVESAADNKLLFTYFSFSVFFNCVSVCMHVLQDACVSASMLKYGHVGADIHRSRRGHLVPKSRSYSQL